MEAALKRLAEELGPIIAEKEVNAHVSPAEGRIHWVEKGLDTQDPDLVQKELRNLLEHVNPLRERYADHPKAKPLLARVEKLEQRIDAELGDIILDREIGEVAPAVESVLYWLMQALDGKKARDVQSYQKQLIEKLQPLRRYAGKPKADAVLNKAQAALNRVETEIGSLIAEIEIKEAASLLDGPLSALSAAVDSRNVQAALRARERVVASSELLRSQYADNKLARPHLDRVDQALARCESEVGDLMAEERVKLIEAQVRGLMATIEHAAKGNEKMVVSATLKKLHGLVYPLRALYGNRKAAITLLQQVDALQGIEINDTVKDTVAKMLQKHTPAWTKLQQQGNASALARELRQLNIDTLPMRKAWMWMPAARDFMLQLDALNLKMLGALPPDDSDRLPIFEISMKLPLEVQNQIKAINSLHADANKKIHELEAALPCPDLSGRSRTNPYSSGTDIGRSISDVSSGIVDRWVQKRAEIRAYTKRLDENQHSPIVKLEALDPKHPVLAQTLDAREQLEKWMTEQMKFWEPRWRYAQRNMFAVGSLTHAEKGLVDVQKVFILTCVFVVFVLTNFFILTYTFVLTDMFF